MGNAEKVAQRQEATPEVSTLVATYMSTNIDGTVNVDFGGGAVTVYSAGFTTPLPGTSVRVLRLNGFTLMLGPVKPNPTYGVVVATGTPFLTVRMPDGTEQQIGYISSYTTPAVDDAVLISWADGPMVIGTPAEVPTSAYIPPETGGGSAAQASPEFVATDSGNFYVPGGSWNYNDPWSSASNTGAFFYNNIAGTIPNSAAISLVQVYLTETFNQHPNVLAKVGLHSLGGKSGNPNIRDAVSISSGSGWKTLPNSFGDALKTGAALGVGFPTVPGGVSYHKFRGAAGGALEGQLRITYTA
ncbi:hypothetical protein EDD25_2816 [Cryobacterium psychrophilum]|nr:hypothetical protein EDD25_2816 [Cryobacterium psychrophilum]